MTFHRRSDAMVIRTQNVALGHLGQEQTLRARGTSRDAEVLERRIAMIEIQSSGMVAPPTDRAIVKNELAASLQLDLVDPLAPFPHGDRRGGNRLLAMRQVPRS
jgi:hypothetical protein